MSPGLEQLVLKEDSGDTLFGCMVDQIADRPASRQSELPDGFDRLFIRLGLPFGIAELCCIGLGLRFQLLHDEPTGTVVWHIELCPLVLHHGYHLEHKNLSF